MFKNLVFSICFVALILVETHSKGSDVPRSMVIRFDGKAICSLIFWAPAEVDDPDLLWGLALAQASERPITLSKKFDYKKFLDKDFEQRKIVLSDKGHAGSAITGLHVQIDEVGALFCDEIAIQHRKNHGRLSRTGWYLSLTDEFLQRSRNRFVPQHSIERISKTIGGEENMEGLAEDGITLPTVHTNSDAALGVLKVYVSQGSQLILTGDLAVNGDLSNDQIWTELVEKIKLKSIHFLRVDPLERDRDLDQTDFSQKATHVLRATGKSAYVKSAYDNRIILSVETVGWADFKQATLTRAKDQSNRWHFDSIEMSEAIQNRWTYRIGVSQEKGTGLKIDD